MSCARTRRSVRSLRWTWQSTCSTACWSWDARTTSAWPNPGPGWGHCARIPDPCNTATRLACRGAQGRPASDTYSKVALAKLYDRKTPLTAADLLNDHIVPFFDAYEVKLSRVLTDRGTEYCGNPERHEDELYLALVHCQA